MDVILGTMVLAIGVFSLLYISVPKLVRRRAAKTSVYPHTLKGTLLTVGGSQKAATVRVDPDVVYITIGRSEEGLVAIPMDQILGVIYQDLSKDGYQMAGLGLVTKEGQYRVFSQRMFSPLDFKTTAEIIRSSYEILTGASLPYSNPNEEILHKR